MKGKKSSPAFLTQSDLFILFQENGMNIPWGAHFVENWLKDGRIHFEAFDPKGRFLNHLYISQLSLQAFVIKKR